ncbi:glycoside hydrolase family 10 protein [Vaginella massiliensis]|uniref:glycoside hydrolase family 10 protein n=1 Tax=Vaginella massiliensis TaxID=1816680 RepID=UPI003751DB65
MKLNKYIAVAGLFALAMSSCTTTRTHKPIYRKIETKSPVVTAPAPASSTTPSTSTTPTIQTPKEEPKIASTLYRVSLPEVNREFRAAWIATVANINWPSRRDLSTDQQKQEAIRLLDMLQEGNFNAVIFQARPSADALYHSNYEPWSYFLTGETGRSPYPYYDPLAFWVEEAHKRGMELHVWLNPYRAHHSSGGSVGSQSMVNKMPNHIVRLRNGMYWFDPASRETQNHVSNVVRDLVKNYDIDGIHFDDYFYPYASYNGGKDFPDDKTWNEYVRNGGKLTRADWRRDNVNRFIERIYNEIKSEKKYVKFGISPFGIWKPGYPAGITGSSQYDELYADAKLWLNKGWIDYFSPQLYWPINSTGQSFPKLLEWWKSENTYNRHLWPGLNTVEVKASDRTSEIVNQVQLSSQILQDNVGVIHWSIAGLIKNPSMLNALKNGPYAKPALIPRSTWIHADPLDRPELNLSKLSDKIAARWSSNQQKDVFRWVLYKQYNDEWETEILDRFTNSTMITTQKFGKKLKVVAIKAVDRLGNESDYYAEEIN